MTDLLPGVNRRLRETRSARLTSWVTIGPVALCDEDVNARGVTDFQTLQTRVWQAFPSAVGPVNVK